MRNKAHKILLLLTLILGLLLRVIWLGRYPIGFTQDEAGLGYDAYSLLKTGKDQWGKTLPLTLRSFGDFKLPLYSYLTIPSVAALGLNEFAVRLPGAICGTLAILFTYLMVEVMTKRKDLALWSGVLLATSPWHISLSRGAFEANLSSFLLPCAIWLFYKGLENYKLLWVSSLFFGLNLFSYHSARIFTPMILIVLLFINRKKIRNLINLKNSKRFITGAVFVFCLFASTSLYTMFTGAGKRATDVVIFNPTDHWAAVAERRYEAIVQGVPEQIARVFSNKPKYILSQFINNYLSYLSPTFLFVQGAGDYSYGMIAGRGVLYLFEIVFLPIALVSYIKKKGFKGIELILAWILLSPIPAAISKAPGFSANRAAIMMPAIQIMSAFGITELKDYLARKFKKRDLGILFTFCVLIILLSSLTSFLEDYIYHAPINAAASMRYGNRQALLDVSKVEDQYEHIFMSRSLSVPQVWVEFYEKWNPADVQKASKDWLRYEKEGYAYLDQLDGYKLGKFTFGSINFNTINKMGKVLIVGTPGEFPETTEALEVINYPDGKPAIYLVDSSEL
jgi:4-amino-4-deoxy-L-arabinose transferase-like glycosyltransferase